MARRSLSQTSFYDPEVVQPACLKAGTITWLLARHRSGLFPPWVLKGWRGEGRLGRDAWPAEALLTLLFLRWSEEGISRVGSTRRAKTDVSWRAAMGLHLQTGVPSERTLRDFEAFLRERHPDCGTPRYLLLHEHIVRWCLDIGEAQDRSVWSIDSTPMWVYGAVLDTMRLLGEGTRMLVGQWARATDKAKEEIAAQWDVPHVLAKSIKGHFRIDWRDEDQRVEMLRTLASGALRAVEQVRHQIDQAPDNRRKRLLRRCRHLLAVIEQNLETDGSGRLVIARKVARDRIVSLTDPSARHGRKTKSKKFKGFKVHILGDVVSGLIAAVSVTPANHHDSSVAHRLIRRAKAVNEGIEMVLGDSAYGGMALRDRIRRELDVEILAPPQSVAKRQHSLGREAIDIDFETLTATCAAGVVAERYRRAWASEYQSATISFHWSKNDCRDCALRPRCCGKRPGGHFVHLHPHEQLLRETRQQWRDSTTRDMYRRRSECERLINQMTRHGARRARGWGLGSAQLQAHLIAMRCNLQLLAQTLAQQEQSD